MAPRFPKLKSFLDFWAAKLDGKLFKVTVAHAKLIRPAELRLIDAEIKIFTNSEHSWHASRCRASQICMQGRAEALITDL